MMKRFYLINQSSCIAPIRDVGALYRSWICKRTQTRTKIYQAVAPERQRRSLYTNTKIKIHLLNVCAIDHCNLSTMKKIFTLFYHLNSRLTNFIVIFEIKMAQIFIFYNI